MMNSALTLVPFKRNEGTTLRNYLKSAFKHFGIKLDRAVFLEKGLIRINGNTVSDPLYYICRGDLVEIISAGLNPISPPPLKIIFQNEDLCVVDKAAGDYSVDSVSGAPWPIEDNLRWRLTKPDSPNPFVAAVHRLDVDTSGVLVIATKRETASILGKAIESRRTEKIYYAVVSPPPSAREFQIDVPIGYDTSRPGFWTSYGKKPREALTTFTMEGKTKDRALLRCKPLTGRTHQIRVHLEFHGTPVLGDRLYGGERWERLLLHCFSMSFPSITKIQSTFESTIPPEFKQALNNRASNTGTSPLSL